MKFIPNKFSARKVYLHEDDDDDDKKPVVKNWAMYANKTGLFAK